MRFTLLCGFCSVELFFLVFILQNLFIATTIYVKTNDYERYQSRVDMPEF